MDKQGDVTAVSGSVDMTGTGDSDSLYGGNGSDTLNGGEGNDSLWGFAGDDTLSGDDGNDRLYGGDGKDTLYGGAGTDVLVGGSGDDTLDGGDGNDVLIGDGQGGFQALIEGTVNAETFQKYLDQQSVADLDGLIKKYDAMDSEGGDDKLFGGAGDDILIGGAGNDYLDGGDGQDVMYAGSGDDVVVYDSSDYLIDGGSGIDALLVDKSEFTGDDITKLLGSHSEKVQGQPLVNGFELVITGDGIDKLGLTSLSDFGITVNHDDDKSSVTLGGQWTKQADGSYTTRFADASGQDVNLTMHIDNNAVTVIDSSIQAMVDQAAQNIAYSNG
ncbi:calcium-binding protein [uncultured Mailhella sp.]|uniref:calcium-binding protein n=1 Tax=uncultured Mailhella sp. TaxID=1981031 RepID=UPI0025FDF7B6|nr:calcium-binding protein [uncultured Mailhella sp.]